MTALKKEEAGVESSLLAPGETVARDAADHALIRQLQGYQGKRPRMIQRRKVTKGAVCLIVGGVFNVLLGSLFLIWTPLDLLLMERLNMRPGLPPYDWWQMAPDIYLKIYVFNVTNADGFLTGKDSRLKLQEIGPIVFKERLTHENITFHDNGTLTYTAHRWPVLMPELNTVNLSDMIVVPNQAVLGMASFLYDASSITNFAFRVLLSRYQSEPLRRMSIEDYLWNNTDPLLSAARTVVPFLMPVSNLGLISVVYRDFVDEVTVHMGPGSDQTFFTMSRYRGSHRFNYWPKEECDAVEGATEGIIYHQFIERNETLQCFRKTLCRVAPLTYTNDVVVDGINAYRFELPDNFFDRFEDSTKDCYASGEPHLRNGLSDLAPCFFNFPVVASAPHFLNGDPYLIDSLEGIKPDREVHKSFVIVEPTSGIPMESCARIQSNLLVRNLSHMEAPLSKFGDLALPMGWFEYHLPELPSRIYYFLYFAVNILPYFQTLFSLILILAGLVMLVASMSSVFNKKVQRRLSYKFLDLLPSSSASSSAS